MTCLLSITIPTFNRAEELEIQLEWLSREIAGFEQDCEIIISDNCSTDATPEILKKWQPAFQKATFRSIRNASNIGLMRNLAQSIHAAQGQYTWTVGDDDPIKSGTLAFILQTLRQQSNLGLLLLNYSGRSKTTGEVVGERWLPQLNGTELDGRSVFQQCVEASIINALFLTATIYRTPFVQDALRQWPDSVNNWGGQAYWTGYCAMQGDVFLAQDIFMECIMGSSWWEKEPDIWGRIYYRDTPEFYLKLNQLGYPHEFCRRMMFADLFDNPWKEPMNLRAYLGALKRWSIPTLKVTVFALSSILASTLATLKSQQKIANVRERA